MRAQRKSFLVKLKSGRVEAIASTAVFTKEPFSGHGWVDERWETSVRVAGLGKTGGGGTCGDMD